MRHERARCTPAALTGGLRSKGRSWSYTEGHTDASAKMGCGLVSWCCPPLVLTLVGGLVALLAPSEPSTAIPECQIVSTAIPER